MAGCKGVRLDVPREGFPAGLGWTGRFAHQHRSHSLASAACARITPACLLEWHQLLLLGAV